jgi:DNA modification methylase/ParB-like chromosome segregation protein Spo0J
MEAPSPIPNEIFLTEIDETDRVRTDYGDLEPLSFSIKEFGLIQPLVVTWDENRWRLLAGGRRYRALQKLGRQSLIHGKEVLVREELYDSENIDIQIIRQSIELEENIKRKDMSWPEQIEAKRRLEELLNQRYGSRGMGGATRSEKAGASISETGVSIRKLAAVLGESPATVSQDLNLAKALAVLPALGKNETKTGALRQLDIMIAVSKMKSKAAKSTTSGDSYILYEGIWQNNISKVADATVDLVFSDLPFGVGLSNMSRHATGTIGYSDDRADIISQLQDLAVQAFRVLRNDKFAVFFFGFNYYPELVLAMEAAGFNVNRVPFIWYKHTRTTENPNTRYGNSYDPALVCCKGSPVLIRPGGANILDLSIETQKVQMAQQPIGVPGRFIEDMTAEGAVVLDFTAGTGTTGEAALQSKRFPILFEKDLELCKYIRGRLSAKSN